MTENEAIKLHISENIHRIEVIEDFLMTNSDANDKECRKNIDILTKINKALEEIQQYRAIGTVEELQKAEKEENILKFYYCNSEDSYLVGLRVGNFYYAHYLDGSWVFDMSRYLPWSEHVKQEFATWKEHTYPSEPREINFSEWLKGFVKKECGGTPEECRAWKEKQSAKKVISFDYNNGTVNYGCPVCKRKIISKIDGKWCGGTFNKYCDRCGQKLDWSDEE